MAEPRHRATTTAVPDNSSKIAGPQLSLNDTRTPAVSVVMVVRNMERFLVESIESVLAQTFRDFEFVIVDFGSTDNSKEIISRYSSADDRIRFKEIPECPLVVARNAACSLAKGRYLAVQDADDISLPDRLEAEVQYLEAHPDFGLVGGLPQWIDLRGNSICKPDFPTGEREIREALLQHCPFSHTSLLIRKDTFDEVGGYRPVMTQSHDYDLILRISEQHRCANLPQVLVKYRIHPFQVTLTKRENQTYCRLAAQTSAASRRAGLQDPLHSVPQITTETLAQMGVTERVQQSHLISDYHGYINSILASGQRMAALKVTQEALQIKWDGQDRQQVAEFHFIAARLYWGERKLLHFLGAAVRTIYLQPSKLTLFAPWKYASKKRD